mmetsp:Transcript_55043/g.101883  ORF Transcript_55043/g.101883 Transcript_55043/m.101883 type:complete len:365 (+) Transcript_55043:77-1171(+)
MPLRHATLCFVGAAAVVWLFASAHSSQRCFIPVAHRLRQPPAGQNLQTNSRQQRLGAASGCERAVVTRRGLPSAAESAAAATSLAPYIGAVVSIAAASTAWQLNFAFTQKPPAAGAAPVRFSGRAIGIGLAWATLIAYAFTMAPGNSTEAKAADLVMIGQLIDDPFSGAVPPLFVGIFNSLGIWPAVYAATLLPGAARQSPVPAWPFLGLSFFAGAFGLSPYLALREYRPKVNKDELDWVTANILENRLVGGLLFLAGAYLALFGVGNGVLGALDLDAAWGAFLPLFMSSQTAHVSCVDFLVLWMFYAPVLLEDGRRRNLFIGSYENWQESERALFLLCAGIPIFGGAAWLALRPPLPESNAAR